jgi:hypothetical protein
MTANIAAGLTVMAGFGYIDIEFDDFKDVLTCTARTSLTRNTTHMATMTVTMSSTAIRERSACR